MLTVSASAISAQSLSFGPSMNMFGTSGLIDMPSAESQPDADFSTTISSFAGSVRGTFTFQVTPRLSGTFRYTKIDNWVFDNETYDRSFDFQYRLLDETKYRPALAIGLRDFMGTGIYSGQYIVATKNITPKLKVTGGVGWGRFSNSNDIQVYREGNLGGKPSVDDWFSGPAGFFGGVEWQTPVKGLRAKVEYSSDKYAIENTLDRDENFPNRRSEITFDRKSPLNFGLEYSRNDSYSVGLYYMYGSELGLRFTTSLNPKTGGRGVRDRAPLPITPRARPVDRSTDWQTVDNINAKGRKQLNTLLNKEGLVVESLALSANRAELRVRNNRYLTTAQAYGRAARAMAFVMPDSVDTFVITPVEQGLPVASMTINRGQLEKFENDPNGIVKSASAFDLSDAQKLPANGELDPELYPDFTWSLAPYVSIKVFDSDDPFAVTGGLRLRGDLDISPGFSISGSVSKKLIKNDFEPSPSESNLPAVRTDVGQYNRHGDPALDRLTADYLFKISPAVYGRVSAGYLEKMYGGVSAEVLYKPVEQNWGLGAEINYVKQRDFDMRLGFRDYSVVTGHVSGYLDMKNGFALQLDAGRYLAGDVGATFSVDRTFDNGWKIGAYATLTDVPAEDFGEGSFDKGVRMEIPLAWAVGTSSKKTVNNTLTSLTRDGGARLNVENRLYPIVKDYHTNAVSGSWGRFWR
ncbi:hypothetical protein GCM10008927_12520 [Amylibacter ulvae]|uniref:YjbH domain-containing protein n=1 Tax=Paramylibacter ulvae TaxID=1651968 RepID=A0ABQ3D059_9RHOB|nr:YjbH domain-containing protein [Amylibacter ulvae]GHA48873.1 hypothetical protein GCM10008927_12520 [Amylibacter ulvae]